MVILVPNLSELIPYARMDAVDGSCIDIPNAIHYTPLHVERSYTESGEEPFNNFFQRLCNNNIMEIDPGE